MTADLTPCGEPWPINENLETMMQNGTLNLALLMGAIPRWPLNPSQIPFQFAAHHLEYPWSKTELAGAPLFIQHLWPGEDRIRFFLSPDAKHYYRMGILKSRDIRRTKSGYIKSGEFMIRAPGMPIAPLDLSFDDYELTLSDPYASVALGAAEICEDTLGPGAQRQRGSALECLVAGGAILYDLPVAYRIQYLEAIGPHDILLVGGLDCSQFIIPADLTVFRGRPGGMAKLKVIDTQFERDQLTIMTDSDHVSLPGDSALGYACATPTARCTIQNWFLMSGFECLLAAKQEQFDAQKAAVATRLGLEPGASEKSILTALGIDFGPFPSREAFEAWDRGCTTISS